MVSSPPATLGTDAVACVGARGNRMPLIHGLMSVCHYFLAPLDRCTIMTRGIAADRERPSAHVSVAPEPRAADPAPRARERGRSTPEAPWHERRASSDARSAFPTRPPHLECAKDPTSDHWLEGAEFYKRALMRTWVCEPRGVKTCNTILRSSGSEVATSLAVATGALEQGKGRKRRRKSGVGGKLGQPRQDERSKKGRREKESIHEWIIRRRPRPPLRERWSRQDPQTASLAPGKACSGSRAARAWARTDSSKSPRLLLPFCLRSGGMGTAGHPTWSCAWPSPE